MLTKEDLLICNTPPNIRDISLELYKEFAEEYLIGKSFHYTFIDGTELDVEFTEWCIYHMLGIQHINGKIGSDSFFEKISNGLKFDDFTKKQSINNRFKKNKKIDNISPTGITQNGINIGICEENNTYILLTILVSKHSDVEEYIKQEELKIVKSLEIRDKAGYVVDTVSYEFILQ